MAKIVLFNGLQNTNQNIGLTRYYGFGVGCSLVTNATEANRQIIYRTAGTITKFSVYVASNTVTADTTFKLRVDGSSVDTITVGSGATGFFQSTASNTITAGQKVCVEVITGGTGTSIRFSILSGVWSTNGVADARFSCTGSNFSTDSTTNFMSIFGSNVGTAENTQNIACNTVGTWRNMAVYVSANARTTTTTFRNRIGGSNGSMSCSFAAGATGLVEDTSNSDAVTSGALINYSITTGTGLSEVITFQTICSSLQSTGKFTTGNASNSGAGIATVNFGSTVYQTISGVHGQTTTEADVQTQATADLRVTDIWCLVQTNTINGSSTITLRKNGADGNNTVTIPSSTAGTFTLATVVDNYKPTDTINFKTVTGGSSGSMTLRVIAVTMSSSVLKDVIGRGVVPYPRP